MTIYKRAFHLLLITFGVFIASASAHAIDADFKIAPNAKQTVLDNGLQVVVVPDRRAPVVTHMLWYRVGAADEAPGQSGVAHFLEHLMFKGTEKYPNGFFSKRVAAIGGQENAFTSYDYTAYYQRIAPEFLREMMEMESDRMRGLILSDEVVLPEREVILEERSSRTGNNPSARLGEALSAALYTNHPYRYPVIGWEHEIQALTSKEAFAFYYQYYRPENAILVVSGDVDVEAVFELARETYGTIASTGPGQRRVRPTEPPSETARTITLVNAQVTQQSVRRSFLAPTMSDTMSAKLANSGSGSDPMALELLAEILGGGPTSRLYRQMVLNGGPASAAGAWYNGNTLDIGTFNFYAVPAGDQDLDDLIEQIQAIAEQIGVEGVSDEELNAARNRMLADAIYAQDSQSALARIIGAGLTTGLDLDSIQNWPSLVAKVSTADVQRVAQKYLNSSTAVTGYLRKPPPAPKDPS